jgi:hypothetical protein
MKIIRLYTGGDDESHFEELELEFEPFDIQEISSVQDVSGIVFRRALAGHVQDWHPAPRRQYVITLAGEGEIEIGDGSKRLFGPGNIMLADDVTGRGHITRSVGSQPRLYATIPLG